jgi:hypothetical protein
MCKWYGIFGFHPVAGSCRSSKERFWFHEICDIYWPAKVLVPSQEGLCSMKSVSYSRRRSVELVFLTKFTFSQQRQETAEFWGVRQWHSVDVFLRDISTNLPDYNASQSCRQHLNIREIWIPERSCLVIDGLSELEIAHELKEASFLCNKPYCRMLCGWLEAVNELC